MLTLLPQLIFYLSRSVNIFPVSITGLSDSSGTIRNLSLAVERSYFKSNLREEKKKTTTDLAKMVFRMSVLATALLGASAVNAHLLMTSPAPYGADSLNNSPLDASGSDFPCKQRTGVYDAAKSDNAYSVGETVQIKLEGSAVHGGGSCQVSLTTDEKPTKDSNWYVIKSIEGGCPVDTSGNLGNNPSNIIDNPSLNFTIPDIDAGKYTMAWTWFNRVGNREMYMNCAPLTVQGGSSSKRSEEEKRSTNYPGMFVANVNGCRTPESVDIRFPEPGDDVAYLGQASNLQQEGESACNGSPSFSGGKGGSIGSPSSSGSGSGSSASSEPSPIVSASLGLSLGLGGGSAPTGGAYAPQAASASEVSAPAPTQSAAPAAESSASSSGSTSNSGSSDSGSGSSSSSSSSSSGASGSCTLGQYNCLDGSSFQQCVQKDAETTEWGTSQQMAAGVTCTVGVSADLGVQAAKLKPRMNSMRFGKRAHGGHRHA